MFDIMWCVCVCYGCVCKWPEDHREAYFCNHLHFFPNCTPPLFFVHLCVNAHVCVYVGTLKGERWSFALCKQCQQVSCPIGKKKRNRQSMQIATPRRESIRCMAVGAEKQGGVEKGQGSTQRDGAEPSWSPPLRRCITSLLCPPSYWLILLAWAVCTLQLFRSLQYLSLNSFFFIMFSPFLCQL